MEPRTLKDDVAKELRERLRTYRFDSVSPGVCEPLAFSPSHVDALTLLLAPLVCELIDHALQMDRVDRGLLPYDEE